MFDLPEEEVRINSRPKSITKIDDIVWSIGCTKDDVYGSSIDNKDSLWSFLSRRVPENGWRKCDQPDTKLKVE